MFHWQYEETLTIEASADAVWALWSHPGTWPTWDKEVKWAQLEGDFVQGGQGQIQPASGPKIAFTLIEVEVGKRFTNRAKLPLTTMDFSHGYRPAENNRLATITHGVTFRGLLAPLFGRLIGRSIAKHLRRAMLELARQAKA